MIFPRTATAGAVLTLALLAATQPAAAVRIPGGGEHGGSGRGQRSYLRPAPAARRHALIEDAPTPAVLVDNGPTNSSSSSSSSNNKRETAASQTSPSSTIEFLRRAFLGLGPEPDPLQEEEETALTADPAPEIQSPKASPLPVPPIDGVLTTLPSPQPAAAVGEGGAPRDLQGELLCAPTLEWTSEGGELLVNGQPFHLKGTSNV